MQGADALAAAYPEAVTVFILPPSLAALEQRLRGRGTESDVNVAIRLDNAKREIARAESFAYTIVNDDVTRASAALSAIIFAERQRTSRHPDLARRVLAGADFCELHHDPRPA